MKVYVGDYKVTMVLIIMGSIMCIASGCVANRFEEELFYIGFGIIVIGILAWVVFHIQYRQKRIVHPAIPERKETHVRPLPGGPLYRS